MTTILQQVVSLQVPKCQAKKCQNGKERIPVQQFCDSKIVLVTCAIMLKALLNVPRVGLLELKTVFSNKFAEIVCRTLTEKRAFKLYNYNPEHSCARFSNCVVK